MSIKLIGNGVTGVNMFSYPGNDSTRQGESRRDRQPLDNGAEWSTPQTCTTARRRTAAKAAPLCLLPPPNPITTAVGSVTPRGMSRGAFAMTREGDCERELTRLTPCVKTRARTVKQVRHLFLHAADATHRCLRCRHARARNRTAHSTMKLCRVSDANDAGAVLHDRHRLRGRTCQRTRRRTEFCLARLFTEAPTSTAGVGDASAAVACSRQQHARSWEGLSRDGTGACLWHTRLPQLGRWIHSQQLSAVPYSSRVLIQSVFFHILPSPITQVHGMSMRGVSSEARSCV